MYPSNESANIAVACIQLDNLMRRKYMVIGAAAITILFLLVGSICVLFLNENWFLCAFAIPFIFWFCVDKYIAQLNTKLNELTKIIRCNYEKGMIRRNVQSTNGIQNEV